MKRLLKYLVYLILLILLNQIYILSSTDQIKQGWWKKSNMNTNFNGLDILELDSNLNWNIISNNRNNTGIIHFYGWDKLLITNLSLTQWHWYDHKK